MCMEKRIMMKNIRKATNPLTKKWEFETNQGYIADSFMLVLKLFHIYPEDVYIPSFLDESQIEFRATEKVRLQIEYVFLRVINANIYRHNNSIVEFEGGDWYAIY